MKWKRILFNERAELGSNTLLDIAIAIVDHDLSFRKQGLMFGNMGTSLFLFQMGKWKVDNHIQMEGLEMLTSLIRRTNTELETMRNFNMLDVSFDTGISGIGWGINYLLQNKFIDNEFSGIFTLTDAIILRRMITVVQEPELDKLYQAIGIGLYAISQDSRLSKEYLRRFIKELFNRVKENDTSKKIVRQSFNTIIGLIRLLEKINVKFPDINHTKELILWFYRVFARFPMSSSTFNLQILYTLLNCYESMSWVEGELNQRAKYIIQNAKNIKIEAGLQKGLVASAHCFNRIYLVITCIVQHIGKNSP